MADRGRILSTVITIVYRTLTFLISFLNVMKYSLAYTFDLTVLKSPYGCSPSILTESCDDLVKNHVRFKEKILKKFYSPSVSIRYRN